MMPRNCQTWAWFIAALIPMVASQFLRLQQSNPAIWILWDYAGRLGALAVLATIPSMRTMAFGREKLKITFREAALWIVGLVLVDHYLGGWIRRTIDAVMPAAKIGSYPHLSGWLYLFDIFFGLALVAFSEEIIFRRCARHIFATFMNDRFGVVVATSLLFGAYHWWSGVGNAVVAIVMGVLLMLFFRRSVALWPVVIAHYLVDIADFA